MLGLDNPLHIAIVLIVVLMVFGAKRLPEMGKSMGEGLRGFKSAVTADSTHAGLTEAVPTPVVPTPAVPTPAVPTPAVPTPAVRAPVAAERIPALVVAHDSPRVPAQPVA
jgi:sec-independent protein translocase protein TatA